MEGEAGAGQSLLRGDKVMVGLARPIPTPARGGNQKWGLWGSSRHLFLNNLGAITHLLLIPDEHLVFFLADALILWIINHKLFKPTWEIKG